MGCSVRISNKEPTLIEQSECSFGCCTIAALRVSTVGGSVQGQSFSGRSSWRPLEMGERGCEGGSRTSPTHCSEWDATAGAGGRGRGKGACYSVPFCRACVCVCVCTTAYPRTVCTPADPSGCKVLAGDLKKWAGRRRGAKPERVRAEREKMELLDRTDTHSAQQIRPGAVQTGWKALRGKRRQQFTAQHFFSLSMMRSIQRPAHCCALTHIHNLHVADHVVQLCEWCTRVCRARLPHQDAGPFTRCLARAAGEESL